MKTLCLYYTRTNATKTAMEHLAKLLEADLAEYTDGKDRSGVAGYIGACFASMKKSYPAITIKGDIQLEDYDRVIVGMPVWVEGPCVIGKAFINQYKDRLPQNVYYAVTHMAPSGYDKKIQAMDKILGRSSAGYVTMQTKEHDFLKDIEDFAKNIIIVVKPPFTAAGQKTETEMPLSFYAALIFAPLLHPFVYYYICI